MKHFFTAIAMMAAVSMGASAEGYRSMAVNLTDGSKVDISLTDNLSATFDENNLLVSDGEQNISVERATIKSFTFSTEPVAGIDAVGADAAGAPTVQGGLMTFTNLPAGTVVAVYSTAGTLLSTETAQGTYTLDLSSLAPGTVIVKVNEVAYKIATR